MPTLRYLTAGESHGQCLVAILEGLPAGLKIDPAAINADLARRQKGYGRSGRMRIEADEVEILAGVRKGESIGSPLALLVRNRDSSIDELPPVTRPRPGHADLAGIIKYAREDARDILERASARENAVRMAVGSVCKLLLKGIGVEVVGHVISIGTIGANTSGLTLEQIRERSEASEVRCADPEASQKMISLIDKAKESGDTLGGVFEVIATGVPVGLGSHAHWDRKLDALLCRAIVSIQAVKGAEIGMGFEAARKFGSEVHDEILLDDKGGIVRTRNNAGGFEGGMTNGQWVVVRGAMKPISTLRKPLRSVDIQTKEEAVAAFERSDVCAVPAAAVIGEAVVAFELARAVLDKFGGDSLGELKRNAESFRQSSFLSVG